MKSHVDFIKRTLALAIKGKGSVEPNPLVGAVVVRNGKIVGEGYHKFFGGPHAEVYALRKAGRLAKGATLYVNLEPCCHFGKTPPCTDLIIKSGVKKVVAAIKDPNPAVSGKGFSALKKAGIKVASGFLINNAMKLNAPFFKFHKTGLPYVISKWAMTLDGKIATRTGDSKWVSGEKARGLVKSTRSSVQAIIIGIETALKDDPHLLAEPVTRTPIRVVLDSSARLPLSSYLVASAREFPTVVVATTTASKNKTRNLERAGCKVLILRHITIRAILKELARLGVVSVLIEGGGEVHASAFREEMVDEIMVFVSPKIIGGGNAKTPVEGDGVSKMAKALKINDFTVENIEGDILVRGYL
ncbi:MAG: riboflavin biosynthesis protein RibD [Planctomycetes bacterium RBG_16_43_13]|nr:MAG: riboflavin biosynthesis protein RibD [Planctomycetes bacterium RBG_16_43_13]